MQKIFVQKEHFKMAKWQFVPFWLVHLVQYIYIASSQDQSEEHLQWQEAPPSPWDPAQSFLLNLFAHHLS